MHLMFNLTYLRSIHYIRSTKGLMISSPEQLGQTVLINAVEVPGPNLNPEEARHIQCLDNTVFIR